MEQEIISKTKRQLRKEKRYEKRRNKLFNTEDIKYSGPLTYRYLRVIAWVAIAISQVSVITTLTTNICAKPFASNTVSQICSVIGGLTIPLFLIASFSLILNRSKSYGKIIISYFAIYLAIGFGSLIFLSRYVLALINQLGDSKDFAAELLAGFVGKRIEFNVFADLFVLSLVNFFINYNPKKIFTGKKVFFFRIMIIIPLMFIAASCLLKYFDSMGTLKLPLQLHPFLATKSFLTHIMFIFISLWIKNRERIYRKFGATNEQFESYLKTNRNALLFSIQICVVFFIFSVIDLFATSIMYAISSTVPEMLKVIDATGSGQCIGLFIAIPVILLFNYTKTHKNSLADMIVPAIGIILIAFVYLEGLRYIAIDFLTPMVEATM